ncbi:MAG: histidinol phosphate phosphatase domain-containing protein, partial [Planctomycetota bacterium]
AITDHVDISTVESIVPQLVRAAEWENRLDRVLVIPGAEVTHVRPEHMSEVVSRARAAGALLVLCHGETLAEPVAPGTNRAAIEAGVDVLAHPGLLTPEEAALAAARNVALEITSKAGHSLTNGYVALLGRRHRARLVFGTDTHLPDQLKTREEALLILRGAGLSEEEAAMALEEGSRILSAKDSLHARRDDPL